MRHSIFDIAGRLPAVLLGLAFVLPTMSVTILIGGTAVLLRVSCALTRLLPYVPGRAPLLCLLCCTRESR
jgi:hypothetical protein